MMPEVDALNAVVAALNAATKERMRQRREDSELAQMREIVRKLIEEKQ